jgi:DNA-binding transcriptional LysR family regulator
MPSSKIRRYVRHGTLTQLSVFEAVARLGSYTRAAEALYMAQPTVSLQIKKLTETVGVQLLEQVGKRVYPTAAGRTLYAGTEQIFKVLSETEDRLADLRSLKTGRLEIAVSATGEYFVTGMLAEFARSHPGIELSLQVHHRETLVERLARNADDLYLFANPPAGEIVKQRLLPNPMCVYAPASHPLAGKMRIRFERLAAEPFLMREEGSGTRMVSERAFADHHIKPKISMELGSDEAIKRAIIAGAGIAILSEYAVGRDTADPAIVTLDVEGFPLERHWYFVYPAGKQPTPVTEQFLQFARGAARRYECGSTISTPQRSTPAAITPTA